MSSLPSAMPSSPLSYSGLPKDELTTTVLSAIQTLPPSFKANFLLDTAVNLIQQGKYGDQVENYLDVYLRTPNLPKEDMAKALMVRANARKAKGEQLIEKALQDFQSVRSLDPSNKEVQSHFRRDRLVAVPSRHSPVSQLPSELWSLIASYIPRYHLRTWLFLSSFHRSIAQTQIFRTLDIYFGSEDTENLTRGLDIFDRVKEDKAFAAKVKTLRLHWGFEEGDMLDLMIRIFRSALPEFKALQDFEWIGYPEMRADIVQTVYASHPHLNSLGLIGWHFDAINVSVFTSLRSFTLRAEDDDGFACLPSELPKLLTANTRTLKHLALGAYLDRDHSWDSAFQSPAIQNLEAIDLVDTRVTQFCLTRIVCVDGLRCLTLHGAFVDRRSAEVVFGSDHIVENGKHTFLPLLEEFRFIIAPSSDDEGEGDLVPLYKSVVSFLRQRRRIRRLDLGGCPWELLHPLLPQLTGLRVLGVRIDQLDETRVKELVRSLPPTMVALSLEAEECDVSMNEYAHHFEVFCSLAFLHFRLEREKRPQPTEMSEKDFLSQTQAWYDCARSVAIQVPTLDFVGWMGEHWVVARSSASPPFASSSSSISVSSVDTKVNEGEVELKELPSRRRLDCAKGVDLGGEDAGWLERKDVPMDYELTGLR